MKNGPDIFAEEKLQTGRDGFASVGAYVNARTWPRGREGNDSRLFKPGTPVAGGLLRQRRGNIRAIRQRYAPMTFPTRNRVR